MLTDRDSPRCLCKCNFPWADRQTDFTSFFYQLESHSFCPRFLCWNLSFSRLTGSTVCKTCRRWGRYSLEGSSDEVLASNTCLFHLGLPSRFWTMMSSYSSHGVLFPQSFWTGSKIFVRLSMGWMNHNTHFCFCSAQTVSQMTARLLKVRPEIITVKNCAGDWTYSCRFECRTIHPGIRGEDSHLHSWVLVPSPMSLSSHCSLNRRYGSTNGVLVWKGFTLMPCSLSNTNTSVFQEKQKPLKTEFIHLLEYSLKISSRRRISAKHKFLYQIQTYQFIILCRCNDQKSYFIVVFLIKLHFDSCKINSTEMKHFQGYCFDCAGLKCFFC